MDLRIVKVLCFLTCLTCWTTFGSLSYANEKNIQHMSFDQLMEEREKLLPAAKAGDVLAQFNLAETVAEIGSYFNLWKTNRPNSQNGETLSDEELEQAHKKVVDETIKYYVLAADQKHVDSNVSLCIMYLYNYIASYVIETEIDKTFYWCNQSAQLGDSRGQYLLGKIYYSGHGVRSNIFRAIELWREAATSEHKGAQLALGTSYYYGDKVPKNYSKAFSWLLKAAHNDSLDAQILLAALYLSGKGTPKNMIECYAWFNVAKLKIEYDESKIQAVEAGLGECENSLQTSEVIIAQNLAENYWRKFGRRSHEKRFTLGSN